jgi:cytochrome c oxidase subunit 7c
MIAARVAARTVARRGFHTTRAQFSSPYHYPEGALSTMPFGINPRGKWFGVGFWTFCAVGFGAPFGIAGEFLIFVFNSAYGGGLRALVEREVHIALDGLLTEVWERDCLGSREVDALNFNCYGPRRMSWRTKDGCLHFSEGIVYANIACLPAFHTYKPKA